MEFYLFVYLYFIFHIIHCAVFQWSGNFPCQPAHCASSVPQEKGLGTLSFSSLKNKILQDFTPGISFFSSSICGHLPFSQQPFFESRRLPSPPIFVFSSQTKCDWLRFHPIRFPYIYQNSFRDEYPNRRARFVDSCPHAVYYSFYQRIMFPNAR